MYFIQSSVFRIKYVWYWNYCRGIQTAETENGQIHLPDHSSKNNGNLYNLRELDGHFHARQLHGLHHVCCFLPSCRQIAIIYNSLTKPKWSRAVIGFSIKSLEYGKAIDPCKWAELHEQRGQQQHFQRVQFKASDNYWKQPCLLRNWRKHCQHFLGDLNNHTVSFPCEDLPRTWTSIKAYR